MMIQVLIVCLLKMLDNLLTTGKTILIQKNKAFLASVVIVISQLLFYFVVSQVINQGGYTLMIVTSIAAGAGSLIAFGVNNRFSKDAIYMNVITSSVRSDIEDLCEHLRDNHIKYVVMDSYSRKWQTTLTVQAFAKTRHESKMIDNYIKSSNGKFLREIL